MSTSDPQDRPAPTEPVPPSSDVTEPSPAAESSAAHEPSPAAEPSPAHEGAAPADLRPAGEGLTVTDDTVVGDRVTDDAARRHAQARPLPTPPEPEPASARRLPPPRFTAARSERSEPAPTPVPDTRTTPSSASEPAPPTPATPGTAAAAAETTPTPPTTPATVGGTATATDEDTSLFPDPNAPRSIGVGTHVLGLVVGLLLPAIAALVTLLGVSRILSVEADGWGARVEVLGIVLVALGALLLGAVALLSLWTPWVGYTGGLLLTLSGALALFAPGVTRTAMLHVVSAEGWQPTVVQTSVAATSGTLLVIGVLILASGIVSHVARRHGIHLGAFRERNSH